MKRSKFVIYGSGVSAGKILKKTNIKDDVIAIVDRDTHEVGETKFGLPVYNDIFLNELDQPFDMIIASMSFEVIYERLKSNNKLSNPNLNNILVANFLGWEPPYASKPMLTIEEHEWAWLEDNLSDGRSKQLLSFIRQERQIQDVYFIPYEEGKYHAGVDDYWQTVTGSSFHEKAVVLDFGAYIGDSVESITRNIGKPIKAYYAFEPSTKSFECLREKSFDGIEEFFPIQAAVGENSGTINFAYNEDHPDSSRINCCEASNDSTTVKLVTIDSLGLNYVADYFVKMDIEGGEMSALKGGRNFIVEKRPNLAICVYHKERDLFEIPFFLKSLVPDYQFFLVGGSHTILIAR